VLNAPHIGEAGGQSAILHVVNGILLSRLQYPGIGRARRGQTTGAPGPSKTFRGKAGTAKPFLFISPSPPREQGQKAFSDIGFGAATRDHVTGLRANHEEIRDPGCDRRGRLPILGVSPCFGRLSQGRRCPGRPRDRVILELRITVQARFAEIRRRTRTGAVASGRPGTGEVIGVLLDTGPFRISGKFATRPPSVPMHWTAGQGLPRNFSYYRHRAPVAGRDREQGERAEMDAG